MEYNKNELVYQFIDLKKKTNLNILQCFKLVFSKIGLVKNIGNYVVLTVIIIFLISGIFFVLKGKELVYNEIEEILKTKKIIINKINYKKDLNDAGFGISDSISSSEKNKNINNKKIITSNKLNS